MSGVVRVLCRHGSLSEKTKYMLFLFKLKTLHLSALVVQPGNMGYVL